MPGARGLNATDASAFRTVAQNGNSELLIQKSRFLGRCMPVSDEREAETLLASIRKRHWDASHNCYAFRIGETAMTARSSDDGEPSGTAGAPILQTLARMGLTNVLCVVTRYFGGVLLGAGGLTRAYGRAASESAKDAGLVEMRLCQRLCLDVPYPYWPVAERELRRFAGPDELDYGESVRCAVYLESARAAEFTLALTECSDGRVRPSAEGAAYRAFPVTAGLE